jgi:hypothetical protein
VCDLETTKILVNEEDAKAPWGAIAPREKKSLIITLNTTDLYYIIRATEVHKTEITIDHQS